MTKELLQQALDALVESRDDVLTCLADRQRLAGIPRYDKQIAFYEAQLVKHDASIEGLKQALAQQGVGINGLTYDETSETASVIGLTAQPSQDLYPLPDSLYPGSKDWMAGSYRERVEWLHGMYESAKQEVARLEAQQEQPAQEQYPLPDSLYPDSKDWQAGSYKERVEWLHLMYESERLESIRLENVLASIKEEPTQPALSEARWNYINSRAVAMSAAKYEALCSLLHAEVDATYDLGEAVDKAIEAHCRGGV